MTENEMMERYIPTIKRVLRGQRNFNDDVFQDACIEVLKAFRKTPDRINDKTVNVITRRALYYWFGEQFGWRGQQNTKRIPKELVYTDAVGVNYFDNVTYKHHTGLTEQEFSVFCSQIKWDDKIAKAFELYQANIGDLNKLGLTFYSMKEYSQLAAKRIRNHIKG